LFFFSSRSFPPFLFPSFGRVPRFWARSRVPSTSSRPRFSAQPIHFSREELKVFDSFSGLQHPILLILFCPCFQELAPPLPPAKLDDAPFLCICQAWARFASKTVSPGPTGLLQVVNPVCLPPFKFSFAEAPFPLEFCLNYELSRVATTTRLCRDLFMFCSKGGPDFPFHRPLTSFLGLTHPLLFPCPRALVFCFASGCLFTCSMGPLTSPFGPCSPPVLFRNSQLLFETKPGVQILPHPEVFLFFFPGPFFCFLFFALLCVV